MKKGRLLNSDLLSAMAKMGHTDQITISDAGLPIPNHVKRIDLAIKKGLPSFLDVLEVVSKEMVIEKIILAEEIKEHNPMVLDAIMNLMPNIQINFVKHEVLKKITSESKAIVRTGECTSYSNIILQSGVDFTGDSHE
jgi:ribose transport protein RbsD